MRGCIFVLAARRRNKRRQGRIWFAVLLSASAVARFAAAEGAPLNVALDEDVRVVKTHLYSLLSRTVRFGDWGGGHRGGAIEPLDDDLLVVSPKGDLALIDPQGRTTFVDGRVPMNLDAARASALTPAQLDKFVVSGALLMQSRKRWRFRQRSELVVAHHHFKKECIRFRLSSALVERRGEAVSASSWRTLFDVDPCFAPADFHGGHMAGGKMLADGQKHLLVAFGDHELPDPGSKGLHPSQASDALWGKLVRVRVRTGAAEVLVYGLRSPGGLARDREGNLWEVEHGPLGGDELNLMLPGSNYGWPKVSYGLRYDQTAFWKVTESSRHEGYAKPVFSWVPSPAISALVVNDERAFPVWRDDLLIGSLRGSLIRVRRDGTTVRYVEQIHLGVPVRDIAWLPNKRLAVLAAGKQRVLFLSPFTYPYCDRESRLKAHMHVYSGGCAEWVADEDAGAPPPGSERGASGASGAELFQAECSACHQLDAEQHSTAGPHLHGLLGRNVGVVSGYGFSVGFGLLNDIVWSPSTLAWFLANPNEFAPGTTMPSQNLEGEEIRAIVDFIATASGQVPASGQLVESDGDGG